MGLRSKTILILGIMLLLAAASVSLVTRTAYERNIDELERESARKAAERAVALVEDDLDQLDVIVRDWAFWDDSWNYMKDRSPEFARSNLSDAALIPLDIGGIAMLDARGNVVFSGPGGGRQNAPFMKNFNAAGVKAESRGLSLSMGLLYLVDARPILRSDGGGEPRGTLMMARPITAERVARYSRLLDMSVRVSTEQHEPAGKGGSLLSESARSITAKAPLIDADGVAVASIIVDMPRSALGGAGKSFAALVIAIALADLVCGMLAVFAIEIAVTGRMRRIEQELVAITTGAGKRRFIAQSGRDELATLAKTMNSTLGSLYDTIEERDVAIREIHHRVKNNLQIIQSLINLQLSHAEEERIGGALRDISRRVAAIAFVHEEIFMEKQIELIDGGRLLDRVAAAVRDSIGQHGSIVASVMGEGTKIRLEQAAPLGLIAGEIIANSYSHAFPKGTGKIGISLARAISGALELRISDDGVGFAPNARAGLGMELVEALSRQLGASFDYGLAEGGGSLFALRIPFVAPEAASH
jgi:Signal transduction histidine kinase